MKFLALILLLFPIFSFAKLSFEDGAYPEIITSARALGMGNAYISKVDDSWSAFYNPAGLGTVRGLQFHITNLHLEMNNGFFDITSGKGSITDGFSRYSEAFKADGMKKLLEENPGTSTHARLNLFPNITVKGLTLGYLYSTQTRSRILKEGDKFETAERTDFGPVMALSASFFGGVLKFGGSVVHLTRKELQKDFEPTDAVSIEGEDYKKGSMTLITVGSRLTLPVALLPTFSFVLRNSSQTAWDSPDLGGAPEKIPQTYDAGFSITPIFGNVFRMHLEVNKKDIQDKYDDVPNKRKLTGGVEFDYKRMMFVRFGYGDGWGSAGIGVRNSNFVFDLTTYGVELSDKFREKEDRRWVLSMAQGF